MTLRIFSMAWRKMILGKKPEAKNFVDTTIDSPLFLLERKN
jgi:hypothetical protein